MANPSTDTWFDALVSQNEVGLGYLLKTNPYPHGATRHGRTLLTHAAAYSSDTLIQMLIDHGAKVDEEDKEGEWPLYVAIWSENEPAVRCLLRAGANPDLFNENGSGCDYLAETHFPKALPWLEDARAHRDAAQLDDATPLPPVQRSRSQRL